jgi:hypothetical protein
MRRSRKIILISLLAIVVLAGSIGGVVMADDANDNGDIPGPWNGFQEKLAEKLGITVEELQATIAEVREELPPPQPPQHCEGWQDKHELAGPFAELDEETRAALKEDLAKIREEMQAKTAEVFESYGIDVDAWKAQIAENSDGERPFFMGPRHMGGPAFGFGKFDGGFHGFGGPCVPQE